MEPPKPAQEIAAAQKPPGKAARMEEIRTRMQEFVTTDAGRAALRELLAKLLSS